MTHQEQTDEFVTYRIFNVLQDALPLLDILKENEIEYEIENASPSLDVTFSASTLQYEYRIKIRASDFTKADSVISNDIIKTIDDIDSDHYLFDFSDDELVEILKKPDEWSRDDYMISHHILSQRGKTIPQQQLDQMRNDRVAFLKETRPYPKELFIAGWIGTILGGTFGLLIGWYILTFRKTIFNGERVFEYDQQSRNEAQKILRIAIVVQIITVILYLWWRFSAFRESNY